MYTVLSRFSCVRRLCMYTLSPTFHPDKETDMGHPCAANPELWFGYPDDDSGDGAAKARAYEQSATEARIQCLRRCPLAQQRRCAQHAIAHRAEYGVWAGVKLPGGQYRKREQLARAHDILRRIAAGEINSRQLPENAALLARREDDALPVTAVVLHLPIAHVGPRSAA
jgi:WhiB family transcriptional regulator, redox-sensing transcriptional regulator